MQTAFWVIREKATGKVMMETFLKGVAEKVNTEKYEAAPILQHLGELNNLNSLARKAAMIPITNAKKATS